MKNLLPLLVFIFFGCASTPSDLTSPYWKTYQKAKAYYEKGKYAAAKEQFHGFIAQEQKGELYKISLFYLADCYHYLDENKQALILFNRLIDEFDSDDFWVLQAQRRLQQIKIPQ